MKITILIGGRAGQGINKVSGIVGNVLAAYGYYSFNYRDYQSLIRGGHNFNVLTIGGEPVLSNESTIDMIAALDERTIQAHKKELRKGGQLFTFESFEDLGLNLNVALAGAIIRTLGIPFSFLEAEVEKGLKGKGSTESLEAAKKGFESAKEVYHLQQQKGKKIPILSGSKAVAVGGRAAGLDLYIAYPMTPSTNALHELANRQQEHGMMVFQAENEIAVATMALGASFAGAKTMIGTSGGGFDLMGEALSLQGMSEVPLTVYLAGRQGPGTGVPTYTSQADLNVSLRAGHGEFCRAVIAPGTPTEVIEKTTESLYLAERFRSLSIVISDKHLAESEYSTDKATTRTVQTKVKRVLPGQTIVKASSYEQNSKGNTTEEAHYVLKNTAQRIKKYEDMKNYISRTFEMIKIHGNKKSKNLVIGWGSTTGAILDAIQGLDVKFLQVLYVKPLSDQIRREMEQARRIILVESNVTGQLGRVLREKTGIKPHKKILRYDGRPFLSDELKKEIQKAIR